MQRPTSGQPSMMFPPLLQTVQNCKSICDQMVTMLLGMPDVQARSNQIRFLIDCATICATLSCYLARYSMFAHATAALCARICEVCGHECAKFSDHHSQMCSQTCMHCAQECAAFAASAA